jgi:RsmE family RNA methyltransferase
VNLILIHPSELESGRRVVLAGQRAKHIHGVLKADSGKSLRVGVVNGPLGTAVVESVNNTEVVLSCTFESTLPEKPKIDLLLAMPRPKVMKRLWAQLSALGVGCIVLVRADKVERFYFDSHVIDPEFYNPLLIEGLQQARCTHLPEVMIRPRFKPFVEDELDELFQGRRRLLADPSGEKRLNQLVSAGEDRMVLAVGPEGGWTSYELQMLVDRQFELFSMGGRVLRSDTAIIGLLSILNESLAGA